MPDSAGNAHPRPLHVSLVAVPDSLLWPVSGLYEVLNAFPVVAQFSDAIPEAPPFAVDIVAPSRSLKQAASGLPLIPHRTIDEVNATDIIIIPSMFVESNEWITGRYQDTVDWLKAMHQRGARLCAACSGTLLLAETGLLDGREATIHWAFEPTFRCNFPEVQLRVERVLVITGSRSELVMSGASASWHDLVLYLVASHVGPAVSQALAKFLALQWHPHGQGPYVTFQEPDAHGDEMVSRLQTWLCSNYHAANPVERLQALSELPGRSFKRRFKQATGYSPLAYVQHLRVEEAKRRLERTNASVEEIGCEVGYENTAFFRRLFKRATGVAPGTYRQQFRLPDFERMQDR